MSQLDLSSPSTRVLQKLIRDQANVQVKTQGGDVFHGQLRWQDAECVCLTVAEGDIVFWRTSLVFMRAVGSS